MGRNRSVKRQNFEKREEEKANRFVQDDLYCLDSIGYFNDCRLHVGFLIAWIEYAARNRKKVSGA